MAFDDEWQSYDEDAFEDLLRSTGPLSEEMEREIDEWLDDAEEADDVDEPPKLPGLPIPGPILVDPTRWLPAAAMSRTETCLRLARHLLVSGIAASDIHVSLTGYELTRRGAPHFPAVRFLGDRGFVRRQSTSTTHEWCGEYASKDSPHRVHLLNAPKAADVVTTVADGRRLLVHANRGSLRETRSSGEHKVLRAVIGRALTFEGYEPTDIPAVAIPRSARFHRLASAWRDSLLVRRAGLQILTVDRAGNVNGLTIGQ